jgi:hypothetical protein
LVFFGAFSFQYFTSFRDSIPFQFNHTFLEAVKAAVSHDENSPVYVYEANGAYVYTLIADETDPNEYLRTVNIPHKDAMFQRIWSFGRFTFFDPEMDMDKRLANGVAGIYVIPTGWAWLFPEYLVKEFEYYSVLEIPPANLGGE